MVSKKLRKVMHRSLAVATSAVLIATASIGAGFTVSAEGEHEDVTETVVSDPKSDNADEQEAKVVGSVTTIGNAIEVSNGGEVTAYGNVSSEYGDGVTNEGGKVHVEGNIDAGSEGSTDEHTGIIANGEATVTVEGNVTGKYQGIEVNNGGSVEVTGNVTGLEDDGIYVYNGGVVRVTGDVTGSDDAVSIGNDYDNVSRGTVTVEGNVTGGWGLYIDNGKVDVSGNVTGDYTGVTADSKSDIKVVGDVTANYTGIRANNRSNVTVGGNVTADVADDASEGATYGDNTGITSSRSNVTVGGNVTSRINGVEARYDSNVTVGGDVTADVFGIKSRDSIISVEGSVKSNRMLGVESKGSNISIGKDVEGDLAGIMAGSYKNMEREEGLVIGIIGSENLEYEMIPSEIRVGGNVTGGVMGLVSDYSSTINVKGDVTASGTSIDNETIKLMNDGRDFDPDDPISKIISTIPSASIGIMIGTNNDREMPMARALAIPADEDVDPEAGANPEEGNQKAEPVKGVIIVEGAAKAEDNGNGAYGVLVANLKNATAEEIIAETPDIVVYEFNLGEKGQVVGYQDYSSMFNRDYGPDFDPVSSYPSVRTLAATSEDTLTEGAPIEGEPSEDTNELAAEVIDTVKGLINYIIKHDDQVTLDSLNDGEDVRVFGDGLETMRIGEVLNIKFQEGYELDNEDYLKTIASVEKISDGVYKITLNSELGGINIKALKKAIEEEIIDDPVVDPDEPDNKEDDPEEKPQEKTNDDPVVVIIEESDPDPAPDSESDPEPASAPAPAVVPLVAVAPAPAPAPVEPAVLGEKREAAVLGARKASTDDTTNSPIRGMIIIIASLGALIVCGTKYCVKER